MTEKLTTTHDAVIAGDQEAYTDLANQQEISAKLGGEKPPAAAPKAEEKPAEAQPEPQKPAEKRGAGSMSHRELRERVRTLEAEIAAAKKPAEPVAEREEAPPAQPEQLRARPKIEDKKPDGKPKYDTWEAYEDDLLAWNEEKIFRSLDERTAKKTQETQVEAVNKAIEQSWADRVAKSREAHEDFDDCLGEDGPGKLIQPGSIVDEWLMDSEYGAELLYHFHQHPEELRKFEKIEGPNPAARRANARRMLVKLEDKIAAASQQQPKPAAEEKPQPKRTPRPSTEVGGRGAQPVDRASAAVASDDTAAYIEEMNRREIAQRLGARR